MKRFFVVSLLFIVAPLAPAFAQTVVSFTAPSSVNSGGFIDFIWDLDTAGGYSFIIPCVPGVSFKYANGTSFPCGIKISSKTKTDDYISLAAYNVSGSTRTITGRLIPKDAGGQDQDALMREARVSVTTDPHPITSFSASATSTIAGIPVTLSWQSSALSGVNLSIECRNEIKASSSAYSSTASLPCDTPIFSADLGPNTSTALNLFNSSATRIPYKVRLLPVISTGLYDGTHAAEIVLDVASNIVPDPEVTLFAASSTIVLSDAPLTVSWSINNAKAANLKISCGGGYVSASSSITQSVIIPCEQLAFPKGLAPSGTLTLWLSNKDSSSWAVTLTLLPGKNVGEYDATHGKSILLSVLPKGAPSSSPSPLSPAPSPMGSPLSSPSPSSSSAKFVFTKGLWRGMQGADVRALQTYLKRDPVLYPEGLVTSYFGYATERAVGRFQKKYGIAAPGTTGYGVVGPKTRAQLNALQ